jgi:outer membrane lipoprotein-sorting protein
MIVKDVFKYIRKAMKQKKSVIVSLLGLIVFFSALYLYPGVDETGAAVIEKSDYVLYGDSTEADIEIKTFRDNVLKKTTAMAAKLKGSDQMIMVFTHPPRSKNNALLKNGDNLWMYYIQRKKFLRIGARQLMGGSDFSYGDILNVNLARDYTAAIVESNINLEGHICYKLELIAKRKKVTYDRIVCYIRKKDFAPIKREFYTKSGQLFKEMIFQDFNGARPMKFLMTNKLINTIEYSIMEFSNLKLNVSLDDRIFTKNYLLRGR